MTAIIRNNFRVHNTRKFIGSLDSVNGTYVNSLYIGIGRPQPWSASSGDNPNPPANNFKDELTDWSDLMFLKRLFSSNICHAIPKRMWASNTYYDMYRHDWNGYSTSPSNNGLQSEVTNDVPTDLSKVKCYCISPTNIVYLCLYVSRDAASKPLPSIVNPDVGTLTVPGTAFTTLASTSIVYCSDGYVWLKLANSTDLIAQFDTLDYYPVQTVGAVPLGTASETQQQWQNSAVSHKGGIYSVLVTSGGSGYLGGSSGSFKITNAKDGTSTAGDGVPHVSIIGDGFGVEYVVQYKGGVLNKIVITNPGYGYTWADVIVKTASGTGGSGLAMLSPLYGLGVDPVKSLSAYYAIIQSIIYDDENVGDNALNHSTDFTVDNDYRKVMIISNPMKNGVLASSNKLDATYGLVRDGSVGNLPVPDDIMYRVTSNGECRVRVVDSGITSDQSGTQSLVRVVQTEFDKPAAGIPNDTIASGGNTYNHSGGTYISTSLIEPDIDLGSGDVIYADYRRPVSRAKKQSEEFKIVVEF